MTFKPIAQEHGLGCGVACTASVLRTSYKKALKLFDERGAYTRGYYLKDIAKALKTRGLIYDYGKVNSKTKKHLKNSGTIVFIKRSKKYPAGHYLLKTNKRWMNPWINYPKINPAKAGFEKKLPGIPQWLLYRK